MLVEANSGNIVPCVCFVAVLTGFNRRVRFAGDALAYHLEMPHVVAGWRFVTV